MNRLEAIPSTTRRSLFLVLLLVLALVLVPAGCKEEAPDSEPSDQAADQTAESSKSLEPGQPIIEENEISITYESNDEQNMNDAAAALKRAFDELEKQGLNGGTFVKCISITYESNDEQNMEDASDALKVAFDELIEKGLGGGIFVKCPRGYELCDDGWCWPVGHCRSIKDKP